MSDAPLPCLDDRVTIAPEVLFCDLDDEAVLLHTGAGQYYGLDAVALRMWQALAEHPRLGDAHAVLAAEFDVDPGPLWEDLLAFVRKLAGFDLLEVAPA